MTPEELRTVLTSRLASVESRIDAACRRASRQRSDITLIAVTKTVDVEVVQCLHELGVTHFGENRPQELWRKCDGLKSPAANWHLIGHLQRNKIERTLTYQPKLIHSVDSLRLLQALESEATKRDQTVPILLEINASREENKNGFAPAEVPQLKAEIAKLTHLRVDGLMAMAAYTADPEICRNTFREVRLLRDQLKTEWELPLPELSMGMSNDFEVAIEEGATLIRLGTILVKG